MINVSTVMHSTQWMSKQFLRRQRTIKLKVNWWLLRFNCEQVLRFSPSPSKKGGGVVGGAGGGRGGFLPSMAHPGAQPIARFCGSISLAFGILRRSPPRPVSEVENGLERSFGSFARQSPLDLLHIGSVHSQTPHPERWAVLRRPWLSSQWNFSPKG